MSVRIQAMSDDECRRYYRTIRSRSEASSTAVFDSVVSMLLTKKITTTATPQQWVECAREALFFCKRCAGTGMFVTMVENGQPKGPGGQCFRCKGRGTQDDHDVRRNEVHDQHYCCRGMTG